VPPVMMEHLELLVHLAKMVDPDLLDQLDLLDLLDPLAPLELLELLEELLDFQALPVLQVPQVKTVSTEHPAKMDSTVPLDLLVDPEPQAPLEAQDLRVMLEPQELMVLQAQLEALDPLEESDLLEPMAPPDPPDPLDHKVPQELPLKHFLEQQELPVYPVKMA